MDTMGNVEAGEAVIVIERDRCIRCLECIDICPQVADLEFPVFERGSDGYPEVANEDSCIRCLSCEVACRAEAIRVGAGGRDNRPVSEDARAELKCRSMF